MRILFIGDVVGNAGCEALRKALPPIKREYGAGTVIVNGENSARTNGIDPQSAGMIFDAGADVITTGNHAFHKRTLDEEYERNSMLLRPANYGSDCPGKGICELDFGAYKAAVINLVGTTFMQPADNPFRCAEQLLKSTDARIVIVDFHAEATSEKRAMGFFLAGKVSAVIGTHTHVQTADEQVINGTGYITDAGMTGPSDSILGVEKNIIINKFLYYLPQKQVFADGACEVCGVCLDIDEGSGKCRSVKRFRKTVP